MSDIEHNQGIESFKITQRINDSLTSWSVSFLSTLTNTDFVTGNVFQISLFDDLFGRTALIGGRILRIGKSKTDNNRVYAISGKDAGFSLVTQPYNLDCSLYGETTFTMEEQLTQILEDTDVVVGSGTPSFDPEVVFHTIGNQGGFCGIYRTKKDAIDRLFKLYALKAGTNKFRWYVDTENRLKWFETGRNRGIDIDLDVEDPLVIDFTIEDNAENIVNDVTGYGCDDESIVSHQTNAASIAQHGRRIGEPIKDSSIKTAAAMSTAVADELRQKAWPIYTAKLVIAGYFDLNCGQQIQFKNDEDYPNIIFTLVQKDIDGSPANVTTTLQFSTDESAIAPPTVTDVTKAIVNNAISNNASDFAEVVDVSENDCTQLLVKPYASDTLVNAQSSNSCTNYNIGGLSGGG